MCRSGSAAAAQGGRLGEMGRRKPSDESVGVMAGSGGDLEAGGSLGWGVDVDDHTGSH